LKFSIFPENILRLPVGHTSFDFVFQCIILETFRDFPYHQPVNWTGN